MIEIGGFLLVSLENTEKTRVASQKGTTLYSIFSWAVAGEKPLGTSNRRIGSTESQSMEQHMGAKEFSSPPSFSPSTASVHFVYCLYGRLPYFPLSSGAAGGTLRRLNQSFQQLWSIGNKDQNVFEVKVAHMRHSMGQRT